VSELKSGVTPQFHPGMRVRISAPGPNPGESFFADVIEVVTPETLKGPLSTDVEAVRQSMRDGGVEAALVLKFIDGSPCVFVFEQMRDGTFRQFRSREAYVVEIVAAEVKMEVQ
jgi:hypothetical protein